MDSDVAHTISGLSLGERAALMQFLDLVSDDDAPDTSRAGVAGDAPAEHDEPPPDVRS